MTEVPARLYEDLSRQQARALTDAYRVGIDGRAAAAIRAVRDRDGPADRLDFTPRQPRARVEGDDHHLQLIGTTTNDLAIRLVGGSRYLSSGPGDQRWLAPHRVGPSGRIGSIAASCPVALPIGPP